MNLWLPILLLAGFLPVGLIFAGAALFFFAWVMTQRMGKR